MNPKMRTMDSQLQKALDASIRCDKYLNIDLANKLIVLID